MATGFEWNGHHIQVHIQPSLKYLWLATETVIYIDDVEAGRNGGITFNEKTNIKFINNGRPIDLTLEVKSDWKTLVSIPYLLSIDGALFSQGRLKISDWYLTLIMPMLLILFSCCICFIFLNFWAVTGGGT